MNVRGFNEKTRNATLERLALARQLIFVREPGRRRAVPGVEEVVKHQSRLRCAATGVGAQVKNSS